LAAFLNKPVGELLRDYFQDPPYPLFAIRRLIDLGDPVAIPSLERAFNREGQELIRQFLAAALVRLGDSNPEYFEYFARRAETAVASDLPFPVQLGTRPQSGGELFPLGDDFLSWVRRNGGEVTSASWQAAFALPAAVEALGEAADPRSRPIFLRGLSSPNILIVFASALGLARLQDGIAVPAIIAAAEREPPEERSMIAKTLLYFPSSEAQYAAERLISDPVRLERWRADVIRRGWKAAMRDNGTAR
jgi:HEAT repeat protein